MTKLKSTLDIFVVLVNVKTILKMETFEAFTSDANKIDKNEHRKT